MIVPIHLDSWAQIQAVETAMLGDKRIFVAPSTGEGEDAQAIGRIGVIALVEESRPSRRGGQRVVVRGTDRAILDGIEHDEPYLRVNVEARPDESVAGPEIS